MLLLGPLSLEGIIIIDEVKEWSNEIETLMSIAKYQAHEAMQHLQMD